MAESRQMKHCVATYAQSCHRGNSSIWTMSVENDEGMERLLTIGVLNRDKEIRQVRGHRNRLPTEKEKEVIRRWAAREGLTLASHV